MKKILATTGLCVSFAGIANATDITSYADLYNQASSGGNFRIISNVDAMNSLGPLSFTGQTAIEGVNSTTTITNGDMPLSYPFGWLDGGADLTLKNITFSNFGGFYTSGVNTIDVDNVIFQNSIYSYSGSIYGGIFKIVDGSSISSIKDSIFQNNRMIATKDSQGGAVYIEGDINSISNTTFKNNLVSSSGSSSWYSYGGALSTHDNNGTQGTISITNSLFDGNTAKATANARVRGGAIYAGSNTILNLTDTDFVNNDVLGNNTTAGYVAGGAIYSNNATINIKADTKNVSFSNNTVNGTKNDIYVAGSATPNKITLDAAAGKSIAFDGTLYTLGGMGNIDITNSGTIVFGDKVSNFNMAIKGGVVQLGKIGTTASKTYLDNVVLDFDGAASGTILSSYKGVIDSVVGNVQIKNANGVGLYLDVTQTSADQYNIIGDSDGNFNLGGVNILSDFTDTNNHNFDIFTGAFTLPTINNGSINIATNNNTYTATGNGDNTITVTQNTTSVPSYDNRLAEAIDNSYASFSFTDNLAVTDSLPKLVADFVVYGNGKTLSADGTKLGFYTDGPTLSLVNIGNMTGFTSELNSFHTSGGAVENEGGTITVYNSSFSENHVNTTTGVAGNALGGAIFNSGDKNSLISGSTFSKNYVLADESSKYALGGAIFNSTSGSGSLTINNSDFIENTAYATDGATGAISEAFGGAIINNNDSNLIISNSRFLNNLAYTTSNNNADSFGGAIYNAQDGKIDISNTIFSGNQAQHSGYEYAVGGAISNGNNGLLSNDGGIVNITNSLFDSNKVGGLPSGIDSKYAYGGAIFNNTTLNITDTVFTNNSANGETALGGAIYNNNGTVTINATNANVLFNNNTTNGVSNDIHSVNGTVNFDGGMNTYLNGGITGTSTINKDGTGALVLSGDNSFTTLNVNKGVLFVRNLSSLSGNLNFADNTIFSLLNNQIENTLLDLTLNGTTTMALDADLGTMQMDTVSANSLNGGGSFNVSALNVKNKTNQQNFSLAFANDILKNNVAFADTKMDISNVYRPYEVSYNNATGQFDFRRGSGYNAIKPQIMAAPAALIAGNYTNQLSLYSQSLDITPEKSGVWVKNWIDNDEIDFDNGPNVDNNSHGIMIGVNNEHYGAFVAYNGGEQKYDGVKVKQNGGAVGLSGMLKNDNWWNKATIAVGFSRAESNNDSWNMINSGIALQSGYDISTAIGTFAPNITASYSYLYADDYNTNNVDINGGNTQAIQLKPGIKWSSPQDWGYRPYVYTNGVWTFADNKAFVADAENLPTFRLDPYMEYGTGIETSIEDWDANLGVSGYSFGRKGVSFNLGMKYNF